MAKKAPPSRTISRIADLAIESPPDRLNCKLAGRAFIPSDDLEMSRQLSAPPDRFIRFAILTPHRGCLASPFPWGVGELGMKRKRKGSGRTASRGKPNPIDVHVGARIRSRRTMLGLSQTTLAEQMGLTFQQVQKYERGTNRVSSSRLYDLGRVLSVPLAYFFDEMSDDIAEQSPGNLQGREPYVVILEKDPSAKRETLELVRAYYAIPDQSVRQRFTKLVRQIAAGN